MQFLSGDSEHLPVPDYDMVDTAVSEYILVSLLKYWYLYDTTISLFLSLTHSLSLSPSPSISLLSIQRLLESLNSSDDSDISHESMIQPGVGGGAVVPLSLSSSVDPLSPQDQPSPAKPSEYKLVSSEVSYDEVEGCVMGASSLKLHFLTIRVIAPQFQTCCVAIRYIMYITTRRWSIGTRCRISLDTFCHIN